MFGLRAGITLSLLFMFGGGAQATVLYDNLSNPILAADPISDDGPQFNSFTTDSTGLVDTIQLMLDTTGDAWAAWLRSTFLTILGMLPTTSSTTSASWTEFPAVRLPDAVRVRQSRHEVLNPDSRYWVTLTDISDVFRIWNGRSRLTTAAPGWPASSTGNAATACSRMMTHRRPTSCASATTVLGRNRLAVAQSRRSRSRPA